ncbi:hypothetical protein MGA3_17697 (plasmid) [Bacillus methanolicus MGA3]|uniref:Uncharacterized protein n=1 Tax=Bacillus methanolicus (strain MGA3 / ATCC 53907) TaxID=796606 RepID=I3DTI4_BACMM|nr:hypothetical protein BMMGA3_16850 [Bacillus methanolicus MGA3]EIJ77555.1 hypothetical protein MGA3_17697 [Bacillus methanolicus MGA3]
MDPTNKKGYRIQVYAYLKGKFPGLAFAIGNAIFNNRVFGKMLFTLKK